ncbi:polypeptide N-acetylgalactosaminyltransferase 17 isoform X2 [Gallus gallus]|uniref:polypeptide N-acetylgalactosaminyltransferase 17 isoform X2 n=1 Tax=Gallus gallus TaxID=9031 RepID=UPI001F0288B6|nr:polypeptide N-acetylgalactosaminyltransferase 17 isoform X2 [Gallus gallus]
MEYLSKQLSVPSRGAWRPQSAVITIECRLSEWWVGLMGLQCWRKRFPSPRDGHLDGQLSLQRGSLLLGDRKAVCFRTPAMIGCSFVVHRKFFGEIGLLDPGMDVYGGENIELGIKVWLCGGSMEVLPCSRVAHIERKKKPYNNNIGFYTKRNALRVAEVWMDDYKSHVYIAWNLPLENPGIDIGDVSERKALRKSLKCKNFQWYLDHVYPEMRRYNNTVAYGELRNNKAKDVCLDQGPQENHTAILYPCHGWGPQLARYTKEGFLHLGALGTTTLLPDTRCLVDNVKSRFPQLLDCDKVKSSLHKRWNFIQNGAILNKGTGRCLEVENRGMAGIDLILRSCTGQRWTIKNFIK